MIPFMKNKTYKTLPISNPDQSEGNKITISPLNITSTGVFGLVNIHRTVMIYLV